LQQQINYIPRGGETENTTLEIPAPPSFCASPARHRPNPQRCALFDGITFEHCRFDLPPSGYAEGQATKHVPRDVPPGSGDPHGQWKFVPWAIEVSYAKQVIFSQCRIRNMGGGGILLGPATVPARLKIAISTTSPAMASGSVKGAERRASDGRPWYQATLRNRHIQPHPTA
jgi:hypothetical protein